MRPKGSTGPGRYDLRPVATSHGRVPGVWAIWWVPDSGPAVQIDTLEESRIPLLADALGRHQAVREQILRELARMDAADRAELLARYRHPSSDEPGEPGLRVVK